MTIKDIILKIREIFLPFEIGVEWSEDDEPTYPELENLISSSVTSLIEDIEKEIKNIPSERPELEDEFYDNGLKKMKEEVLKVINKYKI